jgi:hypothetical protein
MTRLESKEARHKDYHPEVVLMTNTLKEDSFTGCCTGSLIARQATKLDTQT